MANFTNHPKGVRLGGRASGTPNKVTKEFRQVVIALLEKNADNVAIWLEKVAEGHGDEKADPYKALDMIGKLAEYAFPKLARTESEVKHSGDVTITAVSRTIIDPNGH
jgi:hypothetical protein